MSRTTTSAGPHRPTSIIRLNRLLSRSLKDRELGREVLLLGPDDCTGQSSGRSLWWSQTVPQAIDVFDGFSSHTYKHRDTRMLEKWIADRLEHSRQLDPAGPQRPLLVTEFGYVGLTGETFDNPENTAYEYGLFMGDFAIAILNCAGFGRPHLVPVRSVLRQTHCQHYGLWEFKDHDWQPRPAYYSWSMINRYTAANSRVVAVDVTPACESLRAAALVSPAGQQTIMLVNRYNRELQVTLHTGQPRPVTLQVYRLYPGRVFARPPVRCSGRRANCRSRPTDRPTWRCRPRASPCSPN